jgi:hypothetical protein
MLCCSSIVHWIFVLTQSVGLFLEANGIEMWMTTDQPDNVTAPPEAVGHVIMAADSALLVLRIVYLIATKYSWIPIVVTGLFGNVMTITITLQKDNRRISTCNYMTGLALADSMVLIEYTWSMLVLFYGTEEPSEFVLQLVHHIQQN